MVARTRPLAQEQQAPQLIPLTKAAEIMSCHTMSVRRMIADGRLRAYRISNRMLRVDHADVLALLDRTRTDNYAPSLRRGGDGA